MDPPVKQHVIYWTGKNPDALKGCDGLAESIPPLPPPTPLSRTARIQYFWGSMRFDIVVTACSIRTIPWRDGAVTWLHCKAVEAGAIKPDEAIGMRSMLIPVRYVTDISPGPAFRLSICKQTGDIGLFTPNQPTPAEALPLPVIEGILAQLLAAERN